MTACGRREFLQGSLAVAGLGLLGGCGTLPFVRRSAHVPRVGYITAGSEPAPSDLVFRDGLRELGYVEGQTIAIEYRFLNRDLRRASGAATELVGLGVDVIVTTGGEVTAAAKAVTTTVPIVFTLADAVAFGLVANIARPEANVTGLTSVASETVAKRLQLLLEVSPGIARVAVLWNANNAAKATEVTEARRVGLALGLQVLSAEIRGADDVDGAFRAIAASRADALLVLQDTLMVTQSARVALLAAQQRLPAIYEVREYVDAGGLLSYGVNREDRYRRAATYVDKILKGAKPADLPVEQPTVFDFVINLGAARAIGLTIPQSVLLQATEVIE